jgi:predicted ATP-binding protein involved in virulence
MKILKFRAEKVHGYITINLVFNEDLSIITGINGSGKTTALLLMQALLCPNFKDLLTIPFDSIELDYQRDMFVEKISVHSEGNYLIIKHNNISQRLEIMKIPFDELEYIENRKEKTDINEIVRKQIGEHAILKIIKNN